MMHNSLVSGVFVHDKKIGLVRNCKEHNKDSAMPIRLEPVGGKIEAGETEEQAMYREVEEELDRTCTIIRKLCETITHSREGAFTAHMFYLDIHGDYSTLTTNEPQKLDGIMWLDENTLTQWCKKPPEGLLIVPNVCNQLEEITPLLK